MSKEIPDELLNPKQVANYLHRSTKQVRDWIKDGTIPSKQTDAHSERLVSLKALMRKVEERPDLIDLEGELTEIAMAPLHRTALRMRRYGVHYAVVSAAAGVTAEVLRRAGHKELAEVAAGVAMAAGAKAADSASRQAIDGGNLTDMPQNERPQL